MQHADPTVMREHAYMIARGVRPMALVGTCEASDDMMEHMYSELQKYACPGAIPFVVRQCHDQASYGYAAHEWSVELLLWANATPSAVRYKHMITGLLLGYNSHSIDVCENRVKFKTAAVVAAMSHPART